MSTCVSSSCVSNYVHAYSCVYSQFHSCPFITCLQCFHRQWELGAKLSPSFQHVLINQTALDQTVVLHSYLYKRNTNSKTLEAGIINKTEQENSELRVES